MQDTLLKSLFTPVEEITEEDSSTDVIILLHFKCGNKLFVTMIDQVREIVDQSVSIPFPHSSQFTGVFNLRGNIIPILNPLGEDSLLMNSKTRLIVFELEKGDLVAVPANAIVKKEIGREVLRADQDHITLDEIPYKIFNINQQIKALS